MGNPLSKEFTEDVSSLLQYYKHEQNDFESISLENVERLERHIYICMLKIKSFTQFNVMISAATAARLMQIDKYKTCVYRNFPTDRDQDGQMCEIEEDFFEDYTETVFGQNDFNDYEFEFWY